MRISDWSSDVCSSDLIARPGCRAAQRPPGQEQVARDHGDHKDEVDGEQPVQADLQVSRALHLHEGHVVEHGRKGDGVKRQQCARRDKEHDAANRSEEHTSELQSLMRISYAVFCLKKKNTYTAHIFSITHTRQLETTNT